MGSGATLPAFAHLPMLVNERRKKLSKRRDAVAVESYRDQGYLPEALRNYLALLGWSPPGEAEKVDVEVLIESFRLEDVHHAPAFFDVEKLTPLERRVHPGPGRAELRRGLPAVGGPGPRRLAAVDRWTPLAARSDFDPATFERLAPLVQERVAVLGEVPAMVDFVFLADPVIDPGSWAKAIERDEGAGRILDAASSRLRACAVAGRRPASGHARRSARRGRKLAKAQAPIRVAVTGRRVGPPLFESLEVLGRTRSCGGWGPLGRRIAGVIRLTLRWIIRLASSARGGRDGGRTWASPPSRSGSPPASTSPARLRPPWSWGRPSTTGSRRPICGPAWTRPSSSAASGYATLIVVTGTKEPGDAFTEAQASARYLEDARCAGHPPSSKSGETTAGTTLPELLTSCGPRVIERC